jgi:hypothetical protein
MYLALITAIWVGVFTTVVLFQGYRPGEETAGLARRARSSAGGAHIVIVATTHRQRTGAIPGAAADSLDFL